MKVAVYTLTRDRLDYTKRSFGLLREKAGMEFDHYVLDNGSGDGTKDWLETEVRANRIYWCALSPENVGIANGANRCLEPILAAGNDYDLVVKMDNDCEIVSDNILSQLVECFVDASGLAFGPRWALSPRVEGIANQPERIRLTQLAGRRVGITGIIGGLFSVTTADVLSDYRFPAERLSLGQGDDVDFCTWLRGQGGEVGYVEGLVVNHMDTTDGQAQKYPEYFERKFEENP